VAHREEVAVKLLESGARLPVDPDRLKKLTTRATERKWTKLLSMLDHPGAGGPQDEKKN
jgi:hypothetical protein